MQFSLKEAIVYNYFIWIEAKSSTNQGGFLPILENYMTFMLKFLDIKKNAKS